MKMLLLVTATALIGLNASAAGKNCLDISGTYLVSEYGGGMPPCSGGQFSVKTWYKYEQKGCNLVTWSRISKLKDGSFCEDVFPDRVDDGQAHENSDRSWVTTYSILNDRHIMDMKQTSDGSEVKAIFTLDAQGNMAIDYVEQNGYTNHEFRPRQNVN